MPQKRQTTKKMTRNRPSVTNVNFKRQGTRNSIDEKIPTIEVENDSPEESTYICTGDFERDFSLLCQLSDLMVVPPVVPRPKPSGEVVKEKQQAAVVEKKQPPSRKQSLKKTQLAKRLVLPPIQDQQPPDSAVIKSHLGQSAGKSSQSSVTCNMLGGEPPFVPVTFTLKNKFQFFKPSVQVECKQSEDSKTVTEIYIRNWQVDTIIMDILLQCCPPLQQLRALYLCNVGLTPETLDVLLSFLPKCENLTSLTLDANPLGNANLQDLLHERHHLENLSLRFCEVNDLNANDMSKNLGSTSDWNKKLLFLNLANNKISDGGARSLAHSLMTNRTLLTLNLAGNHIGDEGASALAEALSCFPLDQEQLRERRQKMAEWERSLMTQSQVASNASLSDTLSAEMQPRARSMIKFPTQEKKKKSKDKDSASSKPKWVKPSEPTQADSGTTGLRRSRESPSSLSSTESKKRRKSARLAPAVKTLPEITDVANHHPLLETGTLREDGLLWLLGNRSLISLNLARNQIGEKGLQSVWNMLQMQNTFSRGQVQIGKGLKRLEVHRNAVRADNKVLKWIQRHMVSRSPLYRLPLLTLCRDNVSPCALPPLTVF